MTTTDNALVLYGIKNCNSVKKAINALNLQKTPYHFFDYKKQRPDFALFCDFIDHFGRPSVINKQGTAYKKLSDTDKQKLQSEDLQVVYDVVCQNLSVIKRPILLGYHQNKNAKAQKIALIGFDEGSYHF